MNEVEAPESREIITRNDAGQPVTLATLPPGSMAQFLPKSVSELAVVAKFAAQAHLFGVPDQVTALNVMLAGAHLGLTPYASLEGIALVKGRPVVSAQVQWTLILARGQVEEYSIDADAKHCRITVRSRKWREEKAQEVTFEDVPTRLKSQDNYKNHPEDMLFAFCVRRLRKRYFPEVMVGALDRGEMETDAIEGDARVVDVGAVEEHVPEARQAYPCPHRDANDEPDCGEPALLTPGRSGGMFIRCPKGHMFPPPQAVRDAIRGHREGTAAIQREEVPDATTVAGAAPVAGDDQAEGAAGGPLGEPEADRGEQAPAGVAVEPDREFMEAAGIVQPAMTRSEIEEHVKALLSHLAVVKRTPRYEAAQTVLNAHGYDGSPLSTWLWSHPEELPSLRVDLAGEEGALPL